MNELKSIKPAYCGRNDDKFIIIINGIYIGFYGNYIQYKISKGANTIMEHLLINSK